MSSTSAPKRLRWVVALLTALVAALTMVVGSAAGGMQGGHFIKKLEPIQHPADPFTSNVPYLAWKGEHVRVAKCFTLFDHEGRPYGDEATALSDERVQALLSLTGKFRIEDWSGNPDIWPVFVNDLDGTVGTQIVFDPIGKRVGICWNVDATSQKAGLAVVKLTVNLQVFLDLFGVEGFTLLGGYWGTPIVAHQSLVAWMNLNDPVIDDTKKDELSNIAGKDGDQIVGRVTGWIPMGNNFEGMFTGDIVTLPADWEALANVFARNGEDPANGDDPLRSKWRWDIHDDMTPAEGHPNPGYPCDDEIKEGQLFDAVDNCPKIFDIAKKAEYLSEHGFISIEAGIKIVVSSAFQFSTIDGGYTDLFTFGPFDPARPLETMLADGNLNADDTPMPSARLDFFITPNLGDGVDLGGLGAFKEVSKRDVYSRDGSGDATPHNLYAPYYYSYLPATEAIGTFDSGVAGPRHGNNFPGFLDGGRVHGGYDTFGHPLGNAIQAIIGDAPYAYWAFGDGWWEGYGRGEDSECLWYYKFIERDKRYPLYRPQPEGYDHVAVYTDEHGEARVQWVPGYGAFFDQLGKKDANGGCDLQGVGTLGHADIYAVAKYPYQPVFEAVHDSNVIRKVVTSRFNKVLYAEPKGGNAEYSRIVTAWVTDIDGQPNMKVPSRRHDGMDGVDATAEDEVLAEGEILVQDERGRHHRRFREEVCFTALGDAVVTEVGQVTQDDDPFFCTDTDRDGKAQVEVIGQGVVTVIAFFSHEKLKRDLRIDFNATPGPIGTPPVDANKDGKPDQTTPKPSPGANAPTAAQFAASALAPMAKQKAYAVKKAKLIRVKVTKRLVKSFVVVRVDGPSEQAKIRVKVFNRFGKVVASVVRTVETGIEMRVPNLKLAKTAKAVKIQVLA